MHRAIALVSILTACLIPPTLVAQSSLVGAWQRVSQLDSTGAPTGLGPYGFHVYTANGFFSATTIPTSRPKVARGLADMTKDELLARFRGVTAFHGTYTVSGKTLTRRNVAHTDPGAEGADLVQSFRFAGDTLVLTSPNSSNKSEARFVRAKK